MLVRVALESTAGCAVASCASGPEAIEVIPAFRPDVILVDLRMPGMDGMQTLEALRDCMPLDDVCVVFATGVDEDHHLASVRATGAAILPKPFDALALAGQLQDLRAPPGDLTSNRSD